jgi:hypothetical protein
VHLKDCESPINFIPTTVKIVNYFSASDRKAIIIGGLISDTYLSQLFEFDSNLNFRNVLVESLLGKISIVEYDSFNGKDTILLGVERLAIGKMDAVVALKRAGGTEDWKEFELSGFDETKFEILDFLTIQENNLKKLVISSKTGLYQTSIKYIKQTDSITSPICFAHEVYSKQDLTPDYYPIIALKHNPIYSISKISYKLLGDSNWYELDCNSYRISRTEIQVDLVTIWSNLAHLKVAYSFESFKQEERTAVDPSFKSYNGISSAQGTSVSGTFFADAFLSLLWLNPTTKYSDPYPNWNLLPNGMTYQHIPVISGLGNKVFYPTIKSGWNNAWGSEYTSMPELENSLIYYGDSYDSGILSENLNGKDSFLGDQEFGGRFKNNYIDGTWLSNPYISDNYNFSQMYYSDIHDSSQAGLYNYYGTPTPEEQRVLVRNSLTNLELFNSSGVALIYDSGTPPAEISPQYLSSVDYILGLPGSYPLHYAEDDNSLYYEMKSESIGESHAIYANFLISYPDYNGDDFYLSCHIETLGEEGTLKINGQDYISGDVIDFDHMLIEDVNLIRFTAGEEYSPSFTSRIYFFELERVNEGSPAIQGASIEELESVLLEWSQYTSTYKQNYGAFGFEYSYKLPVVGKEGLESIQISFDASISSTSIVKEFPLSLQLWNFEQNRWESIPMAPLDGDATYQGSDLNAEFWAWDPEATSYYVDKFRPKWGTLNFENINTVNYG